MRYQGKNAKNQALPAKTRDFTRMRQFIYLANNKVACARKYICCTETNEFNFEGQRCACVCVRVSAERHFLLWPVITIRYWNGRAFFSAAEKLLRTRQDLSDRGVINILDKVLRWIFGILSRVYITHAWILSLSRRPFLLIFPPTFTTCKQTHRKSYRKYLSYRIHPSCITGNQFPDTWHEKLSL